MGRKILFVTTDQQRYDTLGCNGGTLARTPVVDALAARRASATSAPSRSRSCACRRARRCSPASTRRTHGVWMNGVPLPVDAPSVADVLHDARLPHRARSARRTSSRSSTRSGASPRTRSASATSDRRRRRTATAPRLRAPRVRDARRRRAAALRALAAGRTSRGGRRCSTRRSTRDLQVNAAGGGDTGAPQVHVNPIPRDWYHTDWVADRTIAWLDSLDADDDWFCWMSFPDPHHPWDPPRVGDGPHRLARRAAARRAIPSRRASASAILDAKPRHWRLWYDGTLVSNYEAPRDWVPATLTADQVREVNARNAVECELIDEALGRVLARDRGTRLGRRRRRRSSPPTTASCRATSACCSRGRTTSTR